MACDSTQYYEEDGKAMHYSFRVNKKYELHFIPRLNKFQISDCKKPNSIYLTLDFIPHNLTPQNCTEERIKTMILFS